MKKVTNYQADFELTTLVIPRKIANGANWMEPLWLKAEDKSGLAVFVSALDAEIYRQLAIAEGSLAWRRSPLAHFDLLEHIRDLDGTLHCQMVFGFIASLSGSLAMRTGLPRLRLVPMTFTLGGDTMAPVTFNFKSWVFDFMRAQWGIANATQHADGIELINQANDATLVAAATRALNSIALENEVVDDHEWCIYSADTKKWLFAPDESRQRANCVFR